jgi:hypothetical protein
LSAADLAIRHNETALLRTMRILRHLRPAVDSYNVSGEHVTSGCRAYVQCTSPLRRYHDLYNHYQLKIAMHMASVRVEWMEDVQQELGMHRWRSYMKSPEQRVERLRAIRTVRTGHPTQRGPLQARLWPSAGRLFAHARQALGPVCMAYDPPC